MDNNYDSNDYYQTTGSEGGSKYRLNESSSDVNLNGEQSAPQQNTYNTNPYGGQNPYGNQNPYGGQNPYGNQNPYGGQNPYGPNGGFYGNQNPAAFAMPQTVSSAAINDILVKSFLIMFMALLVTGITALIAAQADFIFRAGAAGIIICFVAELGLVFGATAAMKKNNVTMSAVLFFLYCVVNALTLSVIFYVYTSSSIAQVFFITAIVFGIMAAAGYFAKMDLTKLGNILLIGLIGIILGSVVNMFMHSSGFDMFLTIAGIIVFLGLTAYDVQKIKKMASSNIGLDPMVIGLYGAMQLYLDFINLFLRLLKIMGRARR